MKTRFCVLAAAFLFGGAVLLCPAAELAGRKMVWAHYVAWNTPDNVSLVPMRHYDAPRHDRGTDPFRDEILRAREMGVDGFFIDVCVVKSGPSAFWDLRPFLKAAEGTDFHVGICMDAKTTVEHQTEEIVRMLATYGDHPNYPKMDGRYVVDTVSCIVQGLIPYGAQILIAIGVAKGLDVSIDSFSLLTHLYYQPILALTVILSVIFKRRPAHQL